MGKKTVLALLFTMLGVLLQAWTADPGRTLDEGENLSFSLAPLVSVVWGHSNELVFDESSAPYPYLSRLHWEIKPAVLAGLKGSLNIRDRFFLNAALGTALNSHSGQMSNHDWLHEEFGPSDTGWTHESISDIYLTSSFLLDSNGGYRFVNRESWSMDAQIGYKHIHWAWTDSLVSLDYPDRDLDHLIGVNGIDYRINYNIPYMGLRTALDYGQFSAAFTLLYSFLVSAEDHDHHKLRGLHFYDSFRMGQYLGVSGLGRWRWSDVFSLSMAMDLDWIPEKKGDVVIYTEGGSYRGTYENGAGVSYLTASLSLSLEYEY